MPDISMTNSEAQHGRRRLTRAMTANKKNSLPASAALTFDPDSPMHSRAPTMYNPSSETGMDVSIPTSHEDGGAGLKSLSAMAVDGSAVPGSSRNPLLRNYEGLGLGMPAKKVKLDWQHHDPKEMEQVVEEQGQDEAEQGDADLGGQRRGEGRVIAIDIDHVFDCFTSIEVPQHAEGSDPTISAFTQALQDLHALGHTVHLITSRPEQDRSAVIEWLARQGVSVGLSEQDEVLAVWFTNGFELGFDKSVEDERKIKVLQAINASALIDSHAETDFTQIHKNLPGLQCLTLSLPSSDRPKQTASTRSEPEDKGKDAPGRVQTVTAWEEAVKWVKEWDQKQADEVGSHLVQ